MCLARSDWSRENVTISSQNMSVDREMLMNQRVDHHHASDVNAVRLNMHCSSSTDTHDVKQVLKTFKSAFMLL